MSIKISDSLWSPQITWGRCFPPADVGAHVGADIVAPLHVVCNEGTGKVCSNNTSSSPARIIIADDHELVREAMRSMLHSEPHLRIIDEAKDGQEAIELTRLQHPDLVLMDVRMPKVNGFEATQMIKEELPMTKVLIVSVYEDPLFVSEAVRAGADGYVLKLSPLLELLDAIRGVLGGESQYP